MSKENCKQNRPESSLRIIEENVRLEIAGFHKNETVFPGYL
jgi:hypothetical protein